MRIDSVAKIQNFKGRLVENENRSYIVSSTYNPIGKSTRNAVNLGMEQVRETILKQPDNDIYMLSINNVIDSRKRRPFENGRAYQYEISVYRQDEKNPKNFKEYRDYIKVGIEPDVWCDYAEYFSSSRILYQFQRFAERIKKDEFDATMIAKKQ